MDLGVAGFETARLPATTGAGGGPVDWVRLETREGPAVAAVALATPFNTGQPGLLNVERLAERIDAFFRGHCIGYSAQLRAHGRVRFDLAWGEARKAGDGGAVAQAWTVDTPMHIASLSKLITAVGLVRLLDERGIPLDTPIEGWLPEHWTRGPGVSLISFHNLLVHSSGLSWRPDAPGGVDLATVRDQIAAGTSHHGQTAYRNVNYTLCRLLLTQILKSQEGGGGGGGDGNPPIDAGMPHVNTTLPFTPNDTALDADSISAFATYVQATVFEPAGVIGPSYDVRDGAAWLYAYPHQVWGAPPADERVGAGSDAWYMTVAEAAKVLGALRRGGQTLAPDRFEEMMRLHLGIDRAELMDIGWVRTKGGYWSRLDPDGPVFRVDGIRLPPDGCINQCSGYLLPGEMELVVFCNSDTAPVTNTQQAMLECIAGSIVPRPIVDVTQGPRISNPFGP